MNALEKQLCEINPGFFSKLEETKQEVTLLLGQYVTNFQTYTDHSISHTSEVFNIASEILTDSEIKNLNDDEIYILSMACYLHDIGMCIPEERIKEISESEELLLYKASNPNLTTEEYIRDIHHILSYKFIVAEWELLKIPNLKYAKAIGLVAQGHRKVDLGNFEIYDPHTFVKNGKSFVCLPYLACVLRVADELDVTNSRTPRILTKYYMPNNENSIKEWEKHIATSQRNYRDNKVLFEVDCSDQNIYAALQEQFDKIQNAINYCQKTRRSIPPTESKLYELELSIVEVKYNNIGFDPKGIKFSFDVQNVVTAFIGEELYKDKLTSLREVVQNSIDSCRYKNKVLKENYIPFIKITVGKDSLEIEDNAAGMDEFIIENFFGRLASSFYEQEKIKSQFEAIGQFGVGVFSYFLLSEFIDIETKTSTSSAVKFMFDKDPKSYFHFYDKTTRKEPGTTITMHLKKDLVGELNFKIVESYLRKMFRHIEIPIEVKGYGSESKIEAQSFQIDSQKQISGRLKLQNRRLQDSLKTKAININDDEIEGSCSIIIGKSPLDTFRCDTDHFDRDLFRARFSHHNSMSQISISQKGVFVNYYSSSFLSFTIGDINLKKKERINIDRNEFTDENRISEITRRFEIKLLHKVFSEITCTKTDDLLKITNDFLRNYCNYFDKNHGLNGELAEVFKKHIYVKIYEREKVSVITVQDLINSYPEFCLILDEENAIEVSKKLNIPVAIGSSQDYGRGYNSLRSILIHLTDYKPSIIFIVNRAYEVLRATDNYDEERENIKKVSEIRGTYYYQIVKMDSKKILVDIWWNKPELDIELYQDGMSINYNHFFIQFIIANYHEISSNMEYTKYIRSAFSYITELQHAANASKDSLKKLNEILEPLNKISPLKKFSKSDFFEKDK